MSIVLLGSTSGSCTLAEQAVAGTSVLTLPVGTGTIVANNVNSAIVSKTEQASTSGTSIDFTGIPIWTKRITVIFNGVSTSGTSFVQVQLGDSGGIETTGYISIASGGVAALVTSTSTTGFNIDNSNSTSASARNGIMQIVNVSGNTWVDSGTQGDGSRTMMFAGSKTLSDVLTQVRITTANGTDTFDAGTINILYE
jgi:hypothetical protein